VSQRLGIAETELRSALKKQRNLLQNQQQRQPDRAADSAPDGVARRVDAGPERGGVADGDQRSIGSTTRVERAERELIEILLSSPELIERIHEQVRAEEIRDGFLRRLLDVCYQIHDNGDLPTFERVAASMEDPELKRLLVKIDEEARLKETSLRLNDSEFDLVEETIQVLKWRRERENFESERSGRAGGDESTGGLDDEDKARLRRAFEHHQKRTRQGVIR
jgi:hypothetical protein